MHRAARLIPAPALVGAAALRQCSLDGGPQHTPAEGRYLRALAGAPRSLYLRVAEVDDAALGSVPRMRALYVEDASGASAPGAPPAHAPYAPPAPGASARLRIAQYNMNVLFGPEFQAPHPSAASMHEVLARANADVLLLQEAAQQTFPDEPRYRSGWFARLSAEDARARVAELHALLLAQGYSLVQVNGPFNPALLATRLPIIAVGESFSPDAPPRAPTDETRGARRVLVSLGPGVGALALVATHLHHTERGCRGVRAAEARALLAHLRQQEALEATLAPLPAGLPLRATVLATDMNGTRRQDYTEREWAVLARSLGRAGEPALDGVAELLGGEGWACTYDAGAGAPAFTHWSGQTVDYAWVKQARGGVRALGAWALRTPLSDHLPVVHDLDIAHSVP